MTIDRDEAANSLNAIADVERRTREAMFQAGASPILILWGALLAAGHIGTWFLHNCPPAGRFFSICGLVITGLIVAGYYGAGDWLDLWMAVVFGGGLIVSGLWLAREG